MTSYLIRLRIKSTGYVAESLKRRWLAFELNKSYLMGSKYRFDPVSDLFGNGAIIHGKPIKTRVV